MPDFLKILLLYTVMVYFRLHCITNKTVLPLITFRLQHVLFSIAFDCNYIDRAYWLLIHVIAYLLIYRFLSASMGSCFRLAYSLIAVYIVLPNVFWFLPAILYGIACTYFIRCGFISYISKQFTLMPYSITHT